MYFLYQTVALRVIYAQHNQCTGLCDRLKGIGLVLLGSLAKGFSISLFPEGCRLWGRRSCTECL